MICRACGGSRLTTYLDLGEQPLANALVDTSDSAQAREPRYPLAVAFCHDCKLSQITHTVPPEALFTEYLYFSSYSQTLLDHSAAAVAQHVERMNLGAESFVVEIASNDGYLLQNFVERGIPCLGVEPARNIARIARERGVPTREDFFNEATARELAEDRKADLIIANNVFAHTPDINDFVAGLRELLAPKAQAVLEFPYAVAMIEGHQFDTIYHEHVYYFTLTALIPLFARHGLAIDEVQQVDIHGGSLRLFVGHARARNAHQSVADLLAVERAKGVDTLTFYQGFADRVAAIKAAVNGLLHQFHAQGLRVAAYGASAKGAVLLNYCRPEPGLLQFVVDKSPHKQNKILPGVGLAIKDPQAIEDEKIDVLLILVWNILDEIMAQLNVFRARGGRFLVPIPKPEVR